MPDLRLGQSIATPGPAVVRLSLVGCPYAISWFVIAIVIDSFYRQARSRFRPHIGKEILEGFNPAIANLYSSTSITFKGRIDRIKAAVFHSLPGVVFGADFSARRSAMPEVPLLEHFAGALTAKTAATLASAVQYFCACDEVFPTRTETIPKGTMGSFLRTSARENGNAPLGLSSQLRGSHYPMIAIAVGGCQ